jgi:hypothetical protein
METEENVNAANTDKHKINTRRTIQIQNKWKQASMLLVGFEHAIQCSSGRSRFMP